ncbi:MAG: MopE-related protein, partial [Myxococcota bacterium]
SWFVDGDGDGFGDAATAGCDGAPGLVAVGGDCDDAAAAVNPGAAEVCDGVDTDCDGAVDDGAGTPSWPDVDGDGYGDGALAATPRCEAEPGWAANALDCDDALADVFTGAPERCDGIDQDCDGAIDDGVLVPLLWADVDGDGYGDPLAPVEACDASAGVVANPLDCDDGDAAAHTGAPEACDAVDNDCDGEVDEDVALTWYDDLDGDGFGAAGTDTVGCAPPADQVAFVDSDCDDTDPAVHPGVSELCDTVDQDCDGTVDEGLTVDWWPDADQDSFGDASAPGRSCDAPVGSVDRAGDGDAANDAVHVGVVEACNDIDDDCDGAVDDGLIARWWPDEDLDTYGDRDALPVDTCDPPAGWVERPGDCDDTVATVYTGAVEVCNGVDDDCDADVDDGITGPYWPDEDGDTFGDAAVAPVLTCDPAPGFVGRPGDCDDAVATVFTGAVEVCDGVDDDCDAVVDDGITVPYWPDVDGDGFGDDAVASVLTCDPEPGFVARPGDCDDTVATVFTGAVEVCNGVDDDCDAVVDDRITVPYWPDVDGDGFGDDAVAPVQSCELVPGSVVRPGDCDDTVATVFTGAVEVCNGVDDDCDTDVDDGITVPYWPDVDEDTFGDEGSAPVLTCAPEPGLVDHRGDCDDTDPVVHVFALEVCDELDDDCDGTVDEGVALALWTDVDGDGFGAPGAPIRACVAPPDTTSIGGDCDDADPAVGGPTCIGSIDGDWPTFGGDDQRSGHLAGFVGGGIPSEAWSMGSGGEAFESVAIADGVLYVVVDVYFGGDDHLVAYDLATGTELWDAPIDDSSYPTPPTVEDGRVFLQRANSGDADVMAFDAATGLELWRTPFGVQWEQFWAPLVLDGRVIVGGGTYGGMYGFSAATGMELWFSAQAPWVGNWTPIGADGIVYTQLADEFTAWNPVNGNATATLPLDAPSWVTAMYTVPAIADGVAVMIDFGDLVAVNVDTDEVSWSIDGGFSGSPTIANGAVYAVRDGDLLQIDLALGDQLRRFVGDGALAGKAAVTDDVAIATSADAVYLWPIGDPTAPLGPLPRGGEVVVGGGHLVVSDPTTITVFAMN